MVSSEMWISIISVGWLEVSRKKGPILELFRRVCSHALRDEAGMAMQASLLHV